MPTRYAVAVDHVGVPVHVLVNGVMVSHTAPIAAKGVWGLEPYVVAGANRVTLEIEPPRPGASISVQVRASVGSGWSTVADKSIAPAEAGSVAVEFEGSAPPAPAPDATGIGPLTPHDLDGLRGLLARVHANIVSDPGGELLSLFERCLQFRQGITDQGLGELQARLLEDFASLADPDLRVPSVGEATFELLGDGPLVAPIRPDRRPWLSGQASDGGLVLPMVCAKLGQQWTVVA